MPCFLLEPVDHDVPVLAVRDAENKLVAVLFGYACHNTTLTASFYQLSGDYAGVAQGQVTLAITPNGWGQTPGAAPTFLVLLDARDKGEVLKTNLASLKPSVHIDGNTVTVTASTKSVSSISFASRSRNAPRSATAYDRLSTSVRASPRATAPEKVPESRRHA